MSHAQPSVQDAPVVDPAAAEPVTTTAPEASTDPVRPMATDSLNAESRPELNTAGDVPPSAATTKATVIPPKEEKISKNEILVEAQPINEGVLGYKAPGLVKSLIVSKKFFWFSDESIEPKHLAEYLRTEKPDTHHNVAHASQTGKGILFFAKRAEDKNHPAGILNLTDVTDITKGEFNDFTFKLNGHKHGFQAPTKVERDGWLVAIEASSAGAKANRENLVASEGYKSQLDKLAKPSTLSNTPGSTTAASRSLSRPKKSTDGRVHDGTLPGDTIARRGSSSDEDKAKSKSKSRSQSRKRNSIFGALLGKKEEHDEKKEMKKEEKAEEKAIKQEVKNEDKAEKKAEKEERKLEKEEAKGTKGANTIDPAPFDAVAIASRAVAEPVIPLEGTKPIAAEETAPVTTEASSLPAASSPETAPKPTKRNSIFGSLFGKKEPTSPTAKEFASPLSAKDSEISPVSATAPQIGEPVITSSAEPAPAAPAPAAEISETAPVTTTTATAAAAPSPPATGTEKRRSSFFNNLGSRREKRPDAMSDTEVTDGEGKKSNPSKFGGLFRKPSRATPTKKSAVDPNASVPTAVKEPADGSAPAGNGTPTIIEPSTEPAGTAGLEHKTPVSASA